MNGKGTKKLTFSNRGTKADRHLVTNSMIYIYIYIYICVCVTEWIFLFILLINILGHVSGIKFSLFNHNNIAWNSTISIL